MVSQTATPPLAKIDPRAAMIAQTGAFLTWAMAQDRGLPRIPRRRVDEGGFTELLQRPGARAAADRWWERTLSECSFTSSL